mgnify:CR=1 FL=1
MYFDRHHRAEPLVHAPTVATAHAAAHGTTAHAAHRTSKSAHASIATITTHATAHHGCLLVDMHLWGLL